MRRHAVVAAAAVVVLASLAPSPAAASGRRPRCQPCSQILPPPAAAAPCPMELPAVPPEGRPLDLRALVLEGGGVKGIAYAGSLEVLDRAGHFETVQRVAGTSAGSLVALLVALGYDPAEVQRIVFGVQFEKFRDGRFPSDLETLIDDFGLNSGDYALCLLQCLVTAKLGSPDATFADLEARVAARERGFRRLYVVGTDLNGSSSTTFSYENEATREVPLALAARISMSFPIFFAAVRLALPGGERDVWVDGGVLRNYPIEVFDRAGRPDPRVLGLHLGGAPVRKPIPDFDAYARQLFETLLSVQVDDFCARPGDVERSVFIDPLGISTLDFNLTDRQKCDLVRSGADAMAAYLADGGLRRCPERLAPLTAPTASYPLAP